MVELAQVDEAAKPLEIFAIPGRHGAPVCARCELPMMTNDAVTLVFFAEDDDSSVLLVAHAVCPDQADRIETALEAARDPEPPNPQATHAD